MAKNIDARMSMFGRLAMESGLVTHDEIVACIEEQDKLRDEGLTPPRLGELLVEKNILTPDEVDNILRMQSNPGGLIGRQLLENNLVTREQLRAVLDEQAEMTRTGRAAPRIGEMLVQKGLVKQDDLRNLLRRNEAPGHLFGEFLVSNRLVTQADIDKCLLIQKEAEEKGGKPPKLGEALVQCGVLRKEQVELYSQRHLQGRRNIGAVVAPAGLAARRTNAKAARGDFIIMETLGQHIDGVTYKALHMPSGAVMATHFFSEPDPGGLDGDAFETKWRQAAKIAHPAVQPLFSGEIVNGRRVLVAEFIEGATLDNAIGEAGRISWTWALEIACDLAEVLLRADKLGITHDDIRPGSILVDYAGKARLGLWAYTRDPVGNREWLSKRYKSVSFYHAPERLSARADARSDMFSLGLTLVHAITGKSILRGASLSEALRNSSPTDAMQNLAIDMTLPLGFVSILARMVEAKPENRFATHGELLHALNAFREEQGLDANPERETLLENRTMSAEQASQVVGQFLETDAPELGERKISMRRLLGFYVGPVAAMFAIMLAVTALYRVTQSSQGLMVRANWRDQQGDKAGAFSLYRIISTLYPRDEKVQQRYYDLALEVKDHGEAEIALERLMTLQPENRSQYLEVQADLQVWQKRFLSAVDLYRQVLAAKPHNVVIRTKMAEALLWAQSYPEAQREFADLVALDPQNSAFVLGLARSAAGVRDVDVAARMFAQLNRNGLLSEANLMEYAWLLRDAGRDDELRTVAQGALRRKETDGYSRRNLVYLNYWAGNDEEALRVLNRLTDIAPNDRDVILLRITINSRSGNTDAVIEDYGRLAQFEPDNPEYTTTIARLYQGGGDFANADAFFRQSLARAGNDDVELKAEIARNLSFKGDFDEAVKWYRDVLAQAPNDKAAIQGMVRTLLWGDRYAEAQQYAERLYRENPRNRDNRVNLALVYSRLGKTEEAIPLIDGLVADGSLTRDELESLAINAMSANANGLLLRLIGAEGGDSAKLTELRLVLARRLRANGRHQAALPLYAAVLAATPNPDTALLMEMSETANWAGRHDIAALWLEMARDITAAKLGDFPIGSPGPRAERFRMSSGVWDSLLEPLRQTPELYRSLSGFQRRFSRD